MSLKDKLLFWKKDKFDFDSIGSDPLGTGVNKGLAQDNLGLPSDASGSDPFATGDPTSGAAMPAPSYNEHVRNPSAFSQAKGASGTNLREMELINSKLDTIKALLASLDQRMGIVERIARSEQAEQQKDSRNRLW